MQSTKLVPGISLLAITFALTVLPAKATCGGWTSANYVAPDCIDQPVCQGKWLPAVDFREGFMSRQGLRGNYEFGVLPADANTGTAIHVSHRIAVALALLLVSLLMQFNLWLAVATLLLAPLGVLLFFSHYPLDAGDKAREV